MKLYTEHQLERAINLANKNVSKKSIIESLTPIELPSDEEIKKEKYSFYRDVDCVDTGLRFAFVQGAKWMLDKIQGGNK
jgi:hypothetical protein